MIDLRVITSWQSGQIYEGGFDSKLASGSDVSLFCVTGSTVSPRQPQIFFSSPRLKPMSKKSGNSQ